jgi:hypothetical protein
MFCHSNAANWFADCKSSNQVIFARFLSGVKWLPVCESGTCRKTRLCQWARRSFQVGTYLASSVQNLNKITKLSVIFWPTCALAGHHVLFGSKDAPVNDEKDKFPQYSVHFPFMTSMPC